MVSVLPDARGSDQGPVCTACYQMRVVPTARRLWSVCSHAGVVGACHSQPEIRDRSAEHAHAVDAAARPQDPSYFEGQNQLERRSDLSVAAQLMGKPLDGNYQGLCRFNAA